MIPDLSSVLLPPLSSYSSWRLPYSLPYDSPDRHLPVRQATGPSSTSGRGGAVKHPPLSEQEEAVRLRYMYTSPFLPSPGRRDSYGAPTASISDNMEYEPTVLTPSSSSCSAPSPAGSISSSASSSAPGGGNLGRWGHTFRIPFPVSWWSLHRLHWGPTLQYSQ